MRLKIKYYIYRFFNFVYTSLKYNWNKLFEEIQSKLIFFLWYHSITVILFALKNCVIAPHESLTFLLGVPSAFFMTAAQASIIKGRVTGPRICEVDLAEENYGNVYLIWWCCDGVAVLQRSPGGGMWSWPWTGLSQHNNQASFIIIHIMCFLSVKWIFKVWNTTVEIM